MNFKIKSLVGDQTCLIWYKITTECKSTNTSDLWRHKLYNPNTNVIVKSQKYSNILLYLHELTHINMIHWFVFHSVALFLSVWQVSIIPDLSDDYLKREGEKKPSITHYRLHSHRGDIKDRLTNKHKHVHTHRGKARKATLYTTKKKLITASLGEAWASNLS